MIKSFDLLEKELCKHGIKLTQQQKNRFSIYYEMLLEGNKKVNLTAITDFRDVQEKHFLDSIALAFFLDMSAFDTVIDIGTGAGFPGLPLKIMYPHLKIVLADSLNKRIRFLNETVNALELEDVRCVHIRAEELGKDSSYREKFDLCVSRAVANLSTLSELCIPLVKVGGIFISYKSVKSQDEVNQAESAINLLGGIVSRVEEFKLSENGAGRSFVVVDKLSPTDNKYPRKAGIPEKRPL